MGRCQGRGPACAAVTTIKKPLIWGRNQTRGTPYAGRAFSRARGRAANAKYRF